MVSVKQALPLAVSWFTILPFTLLWGAWSSLREFCLDESAACCRLGREHQYDTCKDALLHLGESQG